MMTQVDTKFKYFPLKDKDIELLMQYRDELIRFDQEVADLKVEVFERSKKAHETSQAKLYQIWKMLAISAGVDPDGTWGDHRYGIESRYLEDGFGALTYSEYPPNILEALMSEGVSVGDEDEKGFDNMVTPEKSKLN